MRTVPKRVSRCSIQYDTTKKYATLALFACRGLRRRGAGDEPVGDPPAVLLLVAARRGLPEHVPLLGGHGERSRSQLLLK